MGLVTASSKLSGKITLSLTHAPFPSCRGRTDSAMLQSCGAYSFDRGGRRWGRERAHWRQRRCHQVANGAAATVWKTRNARSSPPIVAAAVSAIVSHLPCQHSAQLSSRFAAPLTLIVFHLSLQPWHFCVATLSTPRQILGMLVGPCRRANMLQPASPQLDSSVPDDVLSGRHMQGVGCDLNSFQPSPSEPGMSRNPATNPLFLVQFGVAAVRRSCTPLSIS